MDFAALRAKQADVLTLHQICTSLKENSDVNVMALLKTLLHSTTSGTFKWLQIRQTYKAEPEG